MKSLERRRDYCNIPVFSIPHGLVALILNNAGTEKFVINFSSEKEGGGEKKEELKLQNFRKIYWLCIVFSTFLIYSSNFSLSHDDIFNDYAQL